MCPRLPLLVLALLTSDLGLTLGEFPSSITIGAALSAQKHCDKFAEYLEAVNVDEESLPEGVRLNASCVVMNSNPIVAAEMVCDSLIPNQVYTIIASHSATGDLSPMSVSFTAGFYRIPIIGISARDSAFSDKNVHTAFLRTVAPYSEQADIWVDMLATFGFRLVMFIHSTDQEGRTMLSKFQSKLEKKEVEVKLEQSISYTAGQQNFTSTLQQVGELRSRVVLLFACADDAAKIYAEAERMGMISSDYAWIVTEQALRPANTPVGVLGLKLGQSAEDRHLHDAVAIVAKAIKVMALNDVSISPAPSDCHEENVQWESGPDLLSNLMEQELTAADDSDTGLVKFNDVGDRMYSTYQVFNKRPAQSKIADKFVGVYSKDQKLVLNQDAIIWPGNTSQKPKGIQISTHLKVVTIPATPFVYSNVMIGDKCDPGQVHCPRYNETEGTSTDFCCHGYCVDLMNKLSMEVNFTFELHLSGQGQYGSLERRNGNPKKTWNGMIGELVKAESDMIVAPLTINPERALDIDFTKPFKYQGMTILVKKTTKDSSLASFLQPFQDTLWILVGLSVHVVALVLYLLDRFSPFGRFKLAKSDDTEEDALNLSGAVWFAWGVLLNSGIGEGTPRSFSARVLGMVWAGFAMIIVASYTANLAAFLVLDRPEAAISGIDDARLRNPQDTFQYATVQDSAVAMYFKRQVELSTMYRTMEKHFYDNEKEAIQDVKNNKLHAFIWDSSRLEYEAAKDCDLVTAGELFGRSGYGIGLTKGSPWTEEISLKILSFHENGFMERLDNSWILVRDTKCPERDASPATLGLTNMAGVFMMVAGGIMAGVFLIFIEIAYKKHRGLKEKELELAKTAADRWRGNIEKRKLLRQTRAALKNEYLLGEKPNGKSETTYITADASPAAARAQQGQERNNGQPGTYTPLTIQPSRHTSPGRIPARRYQYQV